MSNEFKTKKIGVLMGGISSEREISLRSGKNVLEALLRLGYEAIPIDITSNKFEDIKNILESNSIKVVYNILHGTFGEDGGIQDILEKLKISYTGAGPQSSKNCFNKILTKKILIKNKLPTPDYELVDDPKNLQKKVPLVIKPSSEGSSIGISIVKEEKLLKNFLEKTLATYQEVFVEEFISGAEVTVGVVEKDNALIALPILELRPKKEFYDFEAKYTPGGTEFILPAELTITVTAKVQELAKKAFIALKCSGAARVDFVVKNKKEPYILEINTIPGMTNQSDLPAEAAAAEITFDGLVEIILKTATIGKY